MNKDVVYIEPEDDITDILSDVKQVKSKVVALVPPKKTAVLKSAVNFKLLARTAKETGKAIVVVTNDAALLKLAAAAGVPVAKNLQSKPEIPVVADITDEDEPEGDVIEDKGGSTTTKKDKESADESESTEKIDESKGGKKNKKKSLVPSLDRYRKYIVAGAIGLVVLIGFLVWALVIAPSAKVRVSVRTTARQFSEMVSFTTDESKQDTVGGIFLLEEQRVTKESEVEFVATGEEDRGTKATGTLTVSRIGVFSQDTLVMPQGTKFSQGGKTYISDADVTLPSGERDDREECANDPSKNCYKAGAVKATVKVTAEVAGDGYNMEAVSSGWSTSANSISIVSTVMAGGESKIVKVVTAADIEKAKAELTSVSTTEGREELAANFPTGLKPIASSFKTESEDPVSTPELGAEVGGDVIPILKAKTSFVMYGVDNVRISEYIDKLTQEAISGEGDQTVYATGVSDNEDENKAFFDSFREADGQYTARLKSTTKVGPKVTDQMVVEKSLGRKIGEVQSLLKSINGVSSVTIDTSFFWVTSVPNDINKVSVEITVE